MGARKHRWLYYGRRLGTGAHAWVPKPAGGQRTYANRDQAASDARGGSVRTGRGRRDGGWEANGRGALPRWQGQTALCFNTIRPVGVESGHGAEVDGPWRGSAGPRQGTLGGLVKSGTWATAMLADVRLPLIVDGAVSTVVVPVQTTARPFQSALAVLVSQTTYRARQEWKQDRALALGLRSNLVSPG